MLKRISELLDYIKPDISSKGLDYVFPEVKNIYYLDRNGDTDFIYIRTDKDTFHVAKSLWDRHDKDFESEIKNDEMLETVKQSTNEGKNHGGYELRIQKAKGGYDLTLVEI